MYNELIIEWSFELNPPDALRNDRQKTNVNLSSKTVVVRIGKKSCVLICKSEFDGRVHTDANARIDLNEEGCLPVFRVDQREVDKRCATVEACNDSNLMGDSKLSLVVFNYKDKC